MEVDNDARDMVQPRVNAGMMPRCAGKRVILVGKVMSASPDGEHVQVQAPDGATVSVRLCGPASDLFPGQVYEFLGMVQQDNSLAEEARFQFSENFDLPTYNKMVILAHDARFNNKFWPSS